MRSIWMFVLLIFPAALLLADTHRDLAGNIDFSAFKTFVVREGTNRTQDVDPKLTQAVRDALRSMLSSKGMKETFDSADLIVNFRIEVATHAKEFPGQFSLGHPAFITGIVVIDLTNAATDTVVWHGQYIDEEETLAKVEKHLPENVRKLLSEYPPKKK